MANTPDKNEKLLISLDRGYEADLIKGSLKNSNIPFYIKEHSGPVGFTRFDDNYTSGDIDIFVPEEAYEKAINALPPLEITNDLKNSVAEEAAKDEVAATDSSDNSKKEEVDPEKEKADSKKRTLLTILFIVLAIAVIFGVDSVMGIVRKAMGWE